MDWGEFVELLFKAALAAVLPFAVAALREWLKQQAAELEVHFGVERWAAIRAAVSMAVKAAEQSGIRDSLEKAGSQKMKWAIDTAELYLAERGLGGLDLDVLIAMIEAEVHKQFNGNK